MDLTLKDRLIIANQLRILEKLYPEEAIDYANHRKAIENGYELHYDWLVEWFSEGLSAKECTEVLDILTMYRDITFSYQRLEDKSGIDEKKVRFEGFDGNTEPRLYSYTRYFIIDLGRFDELTYGSEYPELNSHHSRLDKYRRMLEVWRSMQKQPPDHYFSKEELIQILEA